MTVRGWLVKAAGTRAPLVIYYGGNAEELSWQMAEPWPAGWSLALVNYRGYGESGGNPSEAALFGDALAVFDALVQRPDVDASRVVVVGRSLGSGVATYLAAERPVAAVVLISPYDSMTAVARRHYPWLPVGMLLKHPFESASRAPGIRAPLLAIAGGRDGIVPPAHSRRLVEAWGGPKRLVEIGGAGHNDIFGAPQFWPAIDAFPARVQGLAGIARRRGKPRAIPVRRRPLEHCPGGRSLQVVRWRLAEEAQACDERRGGARTSIAGAPVCFESFSPAALVATGRWR